MSKKKTIVNNYIKEMIDFIFKNVHGLIMSFREENWVQKPHGIGRKGLLAIHSLCKIRYSYWSNWSKK